MTCLRESDKKWLRDNCLKLVDASTSQSISHDAGDAGQSTRCSMSLATRNDFDWVHEMASMKLAINSKKNGLRSFSRDQERPAFLQKSSRRTCPHSKRLICQMTCFCYAVFTMNSAMNRSFHWYAYQSNSASTC